MGRHAREPLFSIIINSIRRQCKDSTVLSSFSVCFCITKPTRFIRPHAVSESAAEQQGVQSYFVSNHAQCETSLRVSVQGVERCRGIKRSSAEQRHRFLLRVPDLTYHHLILQQHKNIKIMRFRETSIHSQGHGQMRHTKKGPIGAQENVYKWPKWTDKKERTRCAGTGLRS